MRELPETEWAGAPDPGGAVYLRQQCSRQVRCRMLRSAGAAGLCDALRLSASDAGVGCEGRPPGIRLP